MQTLKYFFLALLSLSISIILPKISYAQKNTTKGYLVPVGGGELDNEFVLNFVALSGVKDPKVLIIPHAAKKLDAYLAKTRSSFKKAGVKNLNVLDLSDPQEALKAIEESDIIWMSGGGQVRLRRALEEASVADAVRRKHQTGTLIGGTSAGASVQSDVMMASSKRDEKTGALTPVISYGLKLWPEVIIDQHFSERKRLERLEAAVKQQPNLIGIGIDEGTGVVYAGGGKFTVMGRGTVTVLKAVDPKAPKDEVQLKKLVLKQGEHYDMTEQ